MYSRMGANSDAVDSSSGSAADGASARSADARGCGVIRPPDSQIRIVLELEVSRARRSAFLLLMKRMGVITGKRAMQTAIETAVPTPLAASLVSLAALSRFRIRRRGAVMLEAS